MFIQLFVLFYPTFMATEYYLRHKQSYCAGFGELLKHNGKPRVRPRITKIITRFYFYQVDGRLVLCQVKLTFKMMDVSRITSQIYTANVEGERRTWRRLLIICTNPHDLAVVLSIYEPRLWGNRQDISLQDITRLCHHFLVTIRFPPSVMITPGNISCPAPV